MSEVINNASAHRYELSIDGQIAIAVYQRRGDVLAFTHTEVPPALEGQGIGSRLIAGALADARAQGLRIAAECSFVADYLDRHPADGDLVC